MFCVLLKGKFLGTIVMDNKLSILKAVFQMFLILPLLKTMVKQIITILLKNPSALS